MNVEEFGSGERRCGLSFAVGFSEALDMPNEVMVGITVSNI